jgi:signal transduction histidine kinase/ligand-binding sensor domain-containing protein
LNILRIVVCSLALALCFVKLGWAVDPNRRISQYAHNVWNVKDGAFEDTPNAIAQTKDGYLWIGTLAGLLRFDGVRFVPATTAEGQLLSRVPINNLLGARDGSLWIGTPSGLSRLKDGELVNYSSTPVGISNIIEDHTGTVWVTRYRVTDGQGPLCKATGKELHCYGKADGIPVEYGVGLTEDSLNNLWVGSYVLTRWRPGSSSKTYFEEELKHLKGRPGVIDLAAGPAGSVWAVLEGVGPKLGVRYFSGQNWSSYVVHGFDGAKVKGHCLLVDRDRTLWIGTENKGLYRIHDGRADHFGSADGLSSDSVNGLFQDKEGNLWVTTDWGVDLFRNTPVISFSIREGLSADSTHSILASHDGSVWVGNVGALDVIRNVEISNIKSRHGLPGEVVQALFEDKSGHLWLGLDDKLMVYDNGKFLEVKNRDGRALATGGGVSAITGDREQNIWAMVSGPRTHHLFRIRDERVREEISLAGIDYPEWLAADPKGSIWIASYGDVLASYRDGHLETTSLAHGDRSFTIQSLVADGGNSVWAATNKGLVHWNDGRWKLLDTQNGLPCSSIFSLVKDDHGSVWLYAQCGLLAISGPELNSWWEQPDHKVAVTVFDSLDGAQPRRGRQQPTAAKSPNGQLWFVNNTVAQMVDPNQLYRNEIPPSVRVEGLLADHKSYLPHDNLRLPALTRDLEIDYTALSFSAPKKVRFRYKLEGRDGDWQEPGTRRQAIYSDLPPDKYRFRVIACNNDGVWNEAGASLAFSVAPAWYQTSAFRFLCIGSLILAVWAIYRLRVRQIANAMSVRFDERLAERTRMARELHDTLLQTIQGSKLVADDALEKSADSDRMRRALEHLSAWLGRAAEEGRAALNSLRTSTTQRNDLAEGFQRAIQECRLHGPIEASFAVAGETQDMHPVVRDEVFRIGYEAIRNACAHSRGSRMEVELTYAHDLTVRVADNGMGIPPSVLDHGRDGHFGLQGMRERAARIGAKLTIVSSAEFGTQITAVVPGSIVFRRMGASRFWKIKTRLKPKGRPPQN